MNLKFNDMNKRIILIGCITLSVLGGIHQKELKAFTKAIFSSLNEPKAPEVMRTDPTSRYVVGNVGRNIYFTMDFKGEPTPTATATVAGEGLPTDVQFFTCDTSATVYIESAQTTHSGTYTIRAENSEGAVERNFTVIILE